MPRANRHFVPGYIWHITHRCHDKHFLLKAYDDRQRWIAWACAARRQYGLCVLNYCVTCNHIHMLVKDLVKDKKGDKIIARSIQLIAGRTAQEYNERKQRSGAFWEDRYHATAIESGAHLRRCIAYIDLNMVRAGAVSNPMEWHHGGYADIQNYRQRNRIIDYKELLTVLDCSDMKSLQEKQRKMVEEAAADNGYRTRQSVWSESIAVGGKEFVESVKDQLGDRAGSRKAEIDSDNYVLREPAAISYEGDFSQKNASLCSENTYYWNTLPE